MSDRSAENLKRMGSVASTTPLDESSTYPATSLDGVGLSIANNDGTTDLIIEITFKSNDVAEYRIAGGGSLNTLFPPFKALDIIQTTSTFDIIVKTPL